VYIKDTQTMKGWGVFAKRPFAAGEVVERSRVIVLTTPHSSLPIELQRLVFDWGRLTNLGAAPAIATGYASLYNHANPANMEYKADTDTQQLVFRTVRAVDVNDELTINYSALGGGATWHDENWFERHKVVPIG
jgi:hypothetical protein